MATELFDIIISLVIGIVFGVIMFYAYMHAKQNKHGPDSRDIVGKIYEYDGICYMLEPVVTICPSSISMCTNKNLDHDVTSQKSNIYTNDTDTLDSSMYYVDHQ